MAIRAFSRRIPIPLQNLIFPVKFAQIPKPQFFSLQSQQQPHYRKQISLANLLRRYGFPPTELRSFLVKNKFFLDSNVSEVEKSLGILISSFELDQNVLVQMLCSCPGVLELDFLKKWEVGTLEFRALGGSLSMIRSIVEFSRRFEKDPDEFCRCFQCLKGLGFSNGSILSILEGFPGVVMIEDCEIERRVEFMASMGMKIDDIDKIYSSCPRSLGFRVEDRLNLLLEDFMKLGFGRSLVRQEIIREPRILGLELGELRQCLEVLKRLKCRVAIKEKIFSEGEFRAGFDVKLRVDCLCRYGLIRRDGMSILRREPRVIVYDIKDLEKKIEFLVQRMNFDIDCLLEVPEYLGVNYDKQIVPRYNVIEYLRSKGALGFEVGLRDIIKPSRLNFYNRYVKPYPECENMFGRFSEEVKRGSRRPAGLWKLFTPPKYANSEEDVKNMRAFMAS